MANNKKIFILVIIVFLAILLLISSKRINQDKVKINQSDLLDSLKIAAEQNDFQGFAENLKLVYQNQWQEIEDFRLVESDLYVRITDDYFRKDDLERSLAIATIIYYQVPEAWRFRYLRIITLEKYGRQALAENNLETAEDFASQILQMMYRPEGANLLADIYFQKIENNFEQRDKQTALNNFNFIRDYEISDDRRELLIELAKQIDKL